MYEVCGLRGLCIFLIPLCKGFRKTVLHVSVKRFHIQNSSCKKMYLRYVLHVWYLWNPCYFLFMLMNLPIFRFLLGKCRSLSRVLNELMQFLAQKCTKKRENGAKKGNILQLFELKIIIKKAEQQHLLLLWQYCLFKKAGICESSIC